MKTDPQTIGGHPFFSGCKPRAKTKTKAEIEAEAREADEKRHFEAVCAAMHKDMIRGTSIDPNRTKQV